MFVLRFVAPVVLFAAIASAAGFSGKISNVPAEFKELFHEKNVHVVNGNNYPSRIQVDLIPLEGQNGAKLSKIGALVDEEYQFKFDGLNSGEYELLVDSYDFILSNTRFRVKVDAEADLVSVFDDFLDSKTYNESSIVNVSKSAPLIIRYQDSKQYYERASGSLWDMVLSSPLGFIFKNQTYTIIFVVCLVIMIVPTAVSYLNPELAESFKEVEPQVAERRIERPSRETPEVIRKPPVASSGARSSDSSARKRR
ncbi:uncharacterized protein RJT20DRAFT_127811 [Scheffersomyces xylosifermentans]|uniref:uncharacterized protein n=1 Tax=Scheffersomyces xylosifermentans TaxID=1304137 RepID=UPI00315D471E